MAMPACECGFHYEDVAAEDVAGRLPAIVDELCAALAGVPDAVLRHRPEPAVWSPLEYCCHLRDVLITQRERVVRILVEDRRAAQLELLDHLGPPPGMVGPPLSSRPRASA